MILLHNLILPAAPSLLQGGQYTVSLHFTHSEAYRVCGPAGSGKTTLLKTLALQYPIQQGALSLFGQTITPQLSLKTKQLIRRRIGILTERPTLCDRLTVFENIALPLHILKTPRRHILRETMAILKWLTIEHLADRFPKTLSSSEILRTACARVLVARPTLLLLEGDTLASDEYLHFLIMKNLYNFINTGCSVIFTTRHDDTMNGLLPPPALRLPYIPKQPTSSQDHLTETQADTFQPTAYKASSV